MVITKCHIDLRSATARANAVLHFATEGILLNSPLHLRKSSPGANLCRETARDPFGHNSCVSLSHVPKNCGKAFGLRGRVGGSKDRFPDIFVPKWEKDEMALFFEIDQARKILELEEAATEREIETAYHAMSLKFHPDRHKPEGKAEAERKMKDVNWAYGLLKDYCARSECRYLFTERAVAKAYPRDAYNMRWAEFMADSSYI